jgi:hypothetical protein
MAEESETDRALELELSDEDILDAMAHISGYIDISTEDFRIIYHLAWKHAVARLQARGSGKPANDGDGSEPAA